VSEGTRTRGDFAVTEAFLEKRSPTATRGYDRGSKRTQSRLSRQSVLHTTDRYPCFHHSLLFVNMLGDEDVFDSVTWETPSGPGYDSSAPAGPGFRQSLDEGAEARGPHDPKWEGYLIPSVRDAVKELAETKDAYVSYLVSAKASVVSQQHIHLPRD
jgi:hypothetical protein